MKYWQLLGLGTEPKGTGKIMSICIFIVLINGYFLDAFIDHYMQDIIVYTCTGIFLIFLIYNLMSKSN